MRNWIICIVVVLFVQASSLAWSLTTITGLEVKSNSSVSEVIIKTDGRIKSYKMQSLSATSSLPERLFCDIEGSILGSGITKKLGRNKDGTYGLNTNNKFIRRVRIAQNSSSVVRVVMDLNRDVRYKTERNSKYPQTLSIYCFPIGSSSQHITRASGSGTQSSGSNKKSGLKYIVIDPGHGGADCGARANGLREKDITLNIGLKLADMINQSGNMKAVMTRSGDTYPSLKERVNIANRYFEKANGVSGDYVFVSIHLNKAPNRKARGFEIYWLGDATDDPEILSLVASENSSDEAAGLQPTNGSDIESYVVSVIQFEGANSSSRQLAEFVGKNLKTETGLPNRKVKPARFRVLHNYKMPAILVEVAFLSNYTDANLLKKSWFQEKAALALYRGIGQYFEDLDVNFQTKSYKSVIVEAPETLIYTVKKGDTISGISQKHGISQRELKRINGLRNNNIYVGQKLKVSSTRAGG